MPSIELLTDDDPPFSMIRADDGMIVGISTEILRAAFEEAKIPYSIHLYPWPRSYAMAEKDENTCVFSTVRNDQREKTFKWVGPLSIREWALFGLPGSPVLSSTDQAKGKMIGTTFGEAGAQLLKKLDLSFEETKDDYVLNRKKLLAHRIDYWLSAIDTQNYLAKKNRINSLMPVIKLSEFEDFVACNKTVSDDIVEKLNNIIAKMHLDGRSAAIRSRYE
jgi:polar amino acid transport system substrate-binding protein